MKKIPFDEKELKKIDEIPGRAGRPSIPVFDFPVSPKEAYLAVYEKNPIWFPIGSETIMFSPQVIPDNISRGFVVEKNTMPVENYGGKDMFGIEWVYVPQVGGSMVRPGAPHLKDISEWKDSIVFPNLDDWDWETSSKENKEFLNNGKTVIMSLFSGCWFERLISFLDFENAAIALIDEEQQEDAMELMDKLTDLYCNLIDKCVKYYDVDAFLVHDDWGAQNAPFFSVNTGKEIIMPYMKKLVAHIHSRGKLAMLHSCGIVEPHLPTWIEAGWDQWAGMGINNTQMLHEKYGDKIHIGVVPTYFDPETTSEEDQRKAAREFVDKFGSPEKMATLNVIESSCITPAFLEELYKYSRIKYSK